jgi:hypothetical protein
VTAEIMLIISLWVVTAMFAIIAYLYSRLRFYLAEWGKCLELAKDNLAGWTRTVALATELMGLWEREQDRADELERQLNLAIQTVDQAEQRADGLQVELRLEQIAHSVEE